MIERFPNGFISNTDPSDRPGQHWVAIYVDENAKAEFFDSYGIKPNKMFMDYLKKYKSYSYNRQRLQDAFSTTCGQYSLCYLFYRTMGLYLSNFLKAFDKTDFHFNDHLITDICKYYFELKTSVFSNRKLNQFCVALGH